MQAQLISLEDGTKVTLKRDVTLVGREPGLCDLLIDRNSVSKIHCLIVKTDGLLFIRDLGSTNGTKVNGQRITRGALLPGDELAFSSVKFRVYLGPDAPNQSERDEQTEVLENESILQRAERLEFAPEDRASDSDVRLIPDDSDA